VVVDAGLGAPSHAAEAMEMGADAVLVNTALADARDHGPMARAFAMAKDLGVETVGAGISGNKVADLQKRLEKDVLDKKPTIVFIYIGINDVWHWKKQADGTMTGGTTKEKFEAGLKEIIGKIKAAGARVILCTPSTIGEKNDGTNERDAMLEEYSTISRGVAKDCGVELLDLRKVFIEYEKANNKDNQPKGILTGDGVHLNKQGNVFVAEQMLKVLGVAPAPAAPAAVLK
ncbi:MAG: GDSL-type esterase/lipase family protein, partial [Planctomycetota bacterium]|nr:GDSL-type esterase/lipase family protein [Planctomycetota bacterium]